MSNHEEHEEESYKRHSHGGHGHGGGAHEEHEGAPEWLISFADNVTLMMGFFVILLAMNLKPADATGMGSGAGAPGPSASTVEMAIAIREAFNNPVDLESTDPADSELISHVLRSQYENAGEDPGLPGKKREVQSIRPSDYFGQGGVFNFDTGAAQLAEEHIRRVKILARELRGLRMIIDIRGHVSAVESVDDPRRGMTLAYERALAVAEALVENGVAWRQLRLMVCGDNDRMTAIAYDEPGHHTNQRVEVTVSDEVMPTEL